MSFYHILEKTGFNWPLAKEVFYNLTDLQIAWLNNIGRRIRRMSSPLTGSKGEVVGSFNLRRER